MMAISQYLDSEGRVKTWPSKHEQKMSIRRTIASKFEHGRFYTEKEVNALINEWHSFNDYFLLRRELVNYGFLERTRSGSQYWKGDISPEKALETETLIIRTAVPDDAEALKKIYMSCAYMAEWTGQKHDETDIDHSISEGELPPDGHKEFYRFKAIVEKQTGYIVGILEYYLGYPNADTFWIGLLLIEHTCQHAGIGSQVVKLLAKEAAAAGFKYMAAGVHLKNWPAIRFWTEMGLDRITAVRGDSVIGADKFSVMALRQDLNEVL